VPATAHSTPEQLLARFGLGTFRPGQREAVQAALDGRDSLVVMPTGAGKSLCYQLPALADDGLVLVVSPLIALMDDQRSRLLAAGVRTAMIASSIEPSRNAAELERIVAGEAQIALLAPERFGSRAFREAISKRRVSLFVVDEAHCVAEWGHDFRPDYLRLHGAIEALGRPAVMASTATATPRVAAEIATRLGLRDWVQVSGGFDRPNICFDVVSVEGKGALARKRAALAHVLADPGARPAIVYCGTRKDTDALAAEIARWGISVVAYHAGMSAQARRCAQDEFMGAQVEVIVATNAFGMGVDKADVRTVAHWAIPTSLEAYYQEAGRGGRDERPARALLLAARMDLGRLIRFNTERDITVSEVRAFVARLRAGAAEEGAEGRVARIERGELDDRGRLLLSIAERAGATVLEPGDGGSLLVELTGRGSPRAAHLAIKAAQDRGWEAYRSIERFVSNTEVCRRRQLLQHFGDSQRVPPLERCCDVCAPDPELAMAIEKAPAARSRSRRPPGPLDSPERRIADAAGTGALLAPAEAEPVDEQAFEQLRRWRAARAEGKPAYTVATNAVLEEVLRRHPSGEQELLSIKGVGAAFCAKHGDSLLHELARM
jgi:RecQ family ATP-dependent DNA helicase